jgi:5,10-methylenetetrahydromethanopterin reductase
MQLSCAFAPNAECIEYVKLAESLGYQRAWFADSPALYGDVWIAIARAALSTERIGLGTAVLIPSLRHVMATASAIASIEEIATGRLTVGIGTGFTGRRMFGKNALPWKEVEAYVRNLKGLLRGFEVTIDGKICKMFHPPAFAPKRPIATPIFVAAGGPRGLKVASEVGDGLICAGVIPEGAGDCALLSFGTVLEAGESFESKRVMDAIGPALALVYHGVYEAAGEGVDAIPGGKGWREEIEAIPEPVRHLYVHENHAVSMTDRDRRHVRPELGGTTFTGTPEELEAKVKTLKEQGVRELIYFPLGPDIPRELRRMADAIGS